jgi:hypothetical protein
MKCYICDSEDDNIAYDPYQRTFGPCHTCLDIISQTVGEYDDRDLYDEEILDDETDEVLMGDVSFPQQQTESIV